MATQEEGSHIREVKANNGQEDYPSLKITYERVQHVLEDQLSMAQESGGKAFNMWVVATAILGIAMPVGFTDSDVTQSGLALMAWAGLVFYIVITALAGLVYFPSRNINLVNDPKSLRENYWPLDDTYSREWLFKHIEKAWAKNKLYLDRTANYVRFMSGSLLVQLLLLLGWVGLPNLYIIG